jgi:hypothetical protein
MKKFLVKQPNYPAIASESEKYSFLVSRGKVHACDMALTDGYYTDTAIITAENLEKVFEEGNFQEYNDNIEKIDTFSSVSVGDVIVDIETKECHVVAPVGFSKILYPDL